MKNPIAKLHAQLDLVQSYERSRQSVPYNDFLLSCFFLQPRFFLHTQSVLFPR